MKNKIYDLIIIGAGPAGLTAGIYAQRYLLKSLILGKIPGGMIAEAHKVCNFPTQNNITGFELTQKMKNHLKELEGEIKLEEVTEIKKEKDNFLVKTRKNKYWAKKIIFATGTEKRKLNIKGEKEFLGKGVSYCATCDAGFFKDKIVAVIGGSNSALTAALLLAEYVKKVYIIYRKKEFFRAEPAWRKSVEKQKNIEFKFNSKVIEINGKDKVEELILNNKKKLKVNGVFIEVGSIPIYSLSEKLKIKNEKGYIIVDKEQKTNIKGIFAAGDVTNNKLKQVITACGEGAIAATTAYEELIKES